MSFVFIFTVPKESLGPQRKILSFYKVLSVNSELKHFLDNCNYFLSTSCLSDSFCRMPSANAVSADASAAMNSHVLFRVPTKQCPGICTGRCTPHSTFLIERAKKHIILPFPPAFICFRKTWIPHFRRCSRMRMQCFTRRNRNEIRMLRKFYQNRNWFFSGKQLEYLRDDFWIPYFKRNRPAKTAVWSKNF